MKKNILNSHLNPLSLLWYWETVMHTKQAYKFGKEAQFLCITLLSHCEQMHNIQWLDK